MVYRTLDEDDPNLNFKPGLVSEPEPAGYIVNILRSDGQLISEVEKLIDDLDHLYNHEESKELPRIHFDRHLYQPLLVEHGDKVKMTPPGLNKSEAQFVQDMRTYWTSERRRSLANMEAFLLRNLSRGKGVGFFEERGFYPDFILWITRGKKQRIVFLEPHGMLHANAYIHDSKARLHEDLPNLANGMAARSKRKNITLASYIISATPYEDLRKKYDDGTWDRTRFAEAHILFLERGDGYDYMERICTNS